MTTEPKPRLRTCVENWPECQSGEYNPSCCRFPKSCSCTSYRDDIPAEQLEQAPMTTNDTRCSYRATDPITTNQPREDGYRCGHDAGHQGGHELFTADGERKLFAGGWAAPTNDTRTREAELLSMAKYPTSLDVSVDVLNWLRHAFEEGYRSGAQSSDIDALKALADKFQYSAWTDVVSGDLQIKMRNANAMTAWLRVYIAEQEQTNE